MFAFDWTINVGNLITILVVTVGISSLYFGIKEDVKILKFDVTAIKEQQKVLSEAFVQLGKILTAVAVQDSRMNMIEKHVDELRHGQGLIKK